ncbi:hypothetical protein B296_00036968 [Ensete ventricosum]|uniref:Uncharacterized protein n=1 Tax=Ensete ventricosum TaxID=4639 RepID=A0A426ZCC2_ENSVE|nr:hypothetical protein B296_00036968 [Ensete ventricosum]
MNSPRTKNLNAVEIYSNCSDSIDDCAWLERGESDESESFEGSPRPTGAGLAMANEIVPAEGPSDPPSRTSSMPSVRPPRVPQYSPSPFDSEKVPPTLVADVRRFLRVANQIESESPRVAYHCKKKPSFPPGSSWTIYISRLTRFLDRHGKKKAEFRDYRSFIGSSSFAVII